MQISGLPVSTAFGAADVLAIEINGVTYKITGATLAAALQSMGDYVTAQDIVNNLTTTNEGYVLDARQGKALLDALEALGDTVEALGDPVEIAHGGTGTATPPTRGGVIYGASGEAYGSTPAGTAGQFLRSTGANAPQWATVDKATIGLGNVDNTRDANKPVSAAQQAAIDAVKDIADNSVHFNEEQTLSAIEQAQSRANIDAASTSDVEAVEDMIDDEKNAREQADDAINEAIDALEEIVGSKRYGVSGIGQRASALTRMWDAVGMTAQVGTDGDNSAIVNDFDNITPFNRRKCVGRWHVVNGRAQFRVLAYQGDANYAEDGSMGDYVAVECPRAYYYLKDGVLGVSAHRYPGWRCFDIFCHDHNQNDTIEYAYLPAYALAMKDGHAVSLPGLDNEQGDYKGLFDKARTYNGDAAEMAILEPFAAIFYDWALYTIEFAQQVPTTTMKGCISLRSSNDDRLQFTDATHAITNNYYATRVVGEYIAITESASHTSVSYQASHRITAIVRCDENGNESASGTHQLLTLEDLGKGYFNYTTGTDYRFAPRPWRTGACNSVSTPSGSLVSNTSGYYPMKYRWRENLWGNQYHTTVDLFNERVADGDSSHLDWYLLKDPTKLNPAVNVGATQLETDLFHKLSVNTPVNAYVNHYIVERQYDEEYPDVWIPGITTSGGSSTTYYAVYANLVNSSVVRAVRFGASWSAGYVNLYANDAPSYAAAHYGGDLCFPQ